MNVEAVAAEIVAVLAKAKDDAERTEILARVCREIYAAGRADAVEERRAS